jgi:hypothetical protein
MRLSQKEYNELIASQMSDSTAFPPIQKTTKYRNQKIYLHEDGAALPVGEARQEHGAITAVFDSQKEYTRWVELHQLLRQGMISDLTRQKTLLIQPSFIYGETKELVGAIKYKADFCYIQDKKVVVEDVKPFDLKTSRYRLTKDFILKWKLLKYKHPDYLFRLY